MERRSVQIRADIAASGRLTGHAAVFNQETRIGDFYEVISPGAFDRVLRERQDTVLQAEHAGLPMASTWAGTLTLGTDSDGLTMDADIADTSLGRDVRVLVGRGDLRSMSFGFTVSEDVWTVRKDGAQLRTITELERLWDVSVVTFPAYAGTDVALRNEIVTPPQMPRITARDQAARIRLAQLLRKD